MKKSFLFILCFGQLMGATAQIKIADETYKEQMTASKYVTEPISIENVFNNYDGTFLKGYYKKNIVGDTLFTMGAKMDCYVVDHTRKTIQEKSFTETPISQGYYRVTGIYVGCDNRGKEISDEIFALVDSNYTVNVNRERLEKHLSSGSGMKLAELNTYIQEEQLKGKKCDLDHYFGAWYRLEALDMSCVYYTRIDGSYEDFFLPVKYYNTLCRELKGKDS